MAEKEPVPTVPSIAGLSTPLSLNQLLEAWIGSYCIVCGRGGNKTPSTWTALQNPGSVKRKHSYDKQRHNSPIKQPRTVVQSSSSSTPSVLLSHQPPILGTKATVQISREERLRAFVEHPVAAKRINLVSQYKSRKTEEEEEVAPQEEEAEEIYDDTEL